MQRSPLIFAAVGQVATFVLAWLVATTVVARIESDARQQAVTALAAAGQNWAAAEPDGMQLVLRGEAPDDAAKFKAIAVLGQVINGERIVDQTSVQTDAGQAAVAFQVEILVADASIALIGISPEVAGAVSLATLVAEKTGLAPDVALLGLGAAPAPQGWSQSQAFALELLPLIENGSLRIRPGAVEVKALAESATSRIKLQSDIAALQPPDVTLSLKIGAPLPVISPFRFSLALQNNVVTFFECSVETGEGRGRILSAVRRAGATELPACQLGIGAPSETWPEAVDLAIAGLEEIGAGRLDITDTEIVLRVLPTSDAAKVEQVRADLTTALPPIYSVKTLRPEVPVEGSQPYRPLFSANLHDDGTLSLTGAIPDDASRIAVETFATSLVGFAKVQNSAKIDGNLPSGWTARVLAGIETMTLLHSGILTVSSEKVYIEGRAASPDIEAEINDALRARLPEGLPFTTLVVTDPALSEVKTPPANKECAGAVAEILSEQQISFAPNSGKIAEESLPVIDDIALVLKNCATAGFEIGGHTDSQGGEVLNQALSQTRADAVLDALLERDVLIAHMSARGYGESQPIGDNETDAGRAKNRRIAFKLLEPSDEQN